MILSGCKMDIDCLGKTQPLDCLMLKRFAPRCERRQQGAAKRQQNENRGRRAQYRGRDTFFAWFNHAASPVAGHRRCGNLVIQIWTNYWTQAAGIGSADAR